MGLQDDYNLDNLTNETERMVFEAIEAEFAEDRKGEICRCEDCVLDVAALALNNISPMYRVSLMGHLYAGTVDETRYAEKVRQAVHAAIEKIRANPSHE